MRVFVAGATGVIGQRLCLAWSRRATRSSATTRSPAKADSLRALGAEPAVVDGLDAMAVGEAVARAAPEVVIHQMTPLAGVTNLRHFDRVFAATNRLRTQGTDHLLAAAAAAGARQFIAQSYTGWPNDRPGAGEDRGRSAGPGPAGRAAAVTRRAPPPGGRGHRGIVAGRRGAAVRLVLRAGGLRRDLRPGPQRKLPVVGDGAGSGLSSTSTTRPRPPLPRWSMAAGVYNIVDDEPAPWLNGCRTWPRCSAPAAAPVPVWLARLAAGRGGRVDDDPDPRLIQREGQGGTGLEPAWPSWRQGFRGGRCPRRASVALRAGDRRHGDRGRRLSGLPAAVFSIAYRMLGSVAMPRTSCRRRSCATTG